MPVALLYVLSAVGLLLAVSRWWSRLSLRDVLVLALLPLVESGEALVRGHVFAPIDLAWEEPPLADLKDEYGVRPTSSGELFDLWTQMIPWQKAVRESVASGEWPLWNPYVLSGEPLLASYQPGVFHPVQLLTLLTPLECAMTFVIAATLLASCTFSFLLLRELSVRAEIAWVGAALWSYSSFHLFWVGWPLALGASGVPLVLFGVLRAFREPSPSWTAAGAGASWILLAGNPEVAAVSAVLGLALSAVVAWRARRAVLVSGFGRLTLAACVAGGIAAAQLAPFIEALPQTAEYQKRREENESESARGNWRLVRAAVIQNLVPLTVTTPGGRRMNPLDDGRPNGWVGSLGLVAGVLAVATLRSWRVRFFAIAWLLGWGVAARLPGAIHLWEMVPLLDLVKPRYGNMVAALALSCLASMGFERAVSGGHRALSRLSLAALIIYSMAAIIFLDYLRTGLDSSRIVWVVLALAVPLAVGVAIFRTDRRLHLVAATALLVVLFERTLEMGRLHQAHPPSLYFPGRIGAELFPARAEPYRVVGLASALPPNTGSLWGFEDIRGYDPMVYGRLFETAPNWARTPRRWLRIVDELTPFHSFLGVRYAVSAKPLVALTGWKELDRRFGLHLYENESALPRFFVPRRIEYAGDPESRLAWLARQRDFETSALIEVEPSASSGSARKGARNGSCTIATSRLGSSYRLDLDCRRPAWVVSSIPAWRGWRAVADGTELPIAIANHAFLAVHAPKGRTDARVDYRPRSFTLGGSISILTLLLLAGWTVRGRWVARARARVSSSAKSAGPTARLAVSSGLADP